MYWIMWIGSTVLWLALYGLGLPVVAVAALFTRTRVSECYPGRVGLHFPSWAWLWDNEENGVNGMSGPGTVLASTNWWTVFAFSALRNPVSNLRFWSPAKVTVLAPGELQVTERAGSYGQAGYGWFIRKGPWIAGYLRFFSLFGKTYRFWWGWEFWPGDAVNGIASTDGRYPGVDFARQFHVYS